MHSTSAGSSGVTVAEVVRLPLTPPDGSGYLRHEHLTLDVLGGLSWHPDTAPCERRVVVDLGTSHGFAPGVTEEVARYLVDAGARHVEVWSSARPGVRDAFASRLRVALAEAAQVLA